MTHDGRQVEPPIDILRFDGEDDDVGRAPRYPSKRPQDSHVVARLPAVADIEPGFLGESIDRSRLLSTTRRIYHNQTIEPVEIERDIRVGPRVDDLHSIGKGHFGQSTGDVNADALILHQTVPDSDDCRSHSIS